MLSIICLSAWRNNKGQTSWLPVNYHHMLHLLPGASKVQKLSQGLHWLWRTKFMPKRRITTCCMFSAGSRTTASKYTILQILGSFRLFFLLLSLCTPSHFKRWEASNFVWDVHSENSTWICCIFKAYLNVLLPSVRHLLILFPIPYLIVQSMRTEDAEQWEFGCVTDAHWCLFIESHFIWKAFSFERGF